LIELGKRFCERALTMSELVTKSVAQEQQERSVERHTAVKGITGFTIVATAVAVFAILATVVYAQNKYSLKSPGGIAFSDFRGYEDWAVVSSARTDEVLKVIVANPAMIKAYKAGVPGNGQPFADGVHGREAPMEAEEEHGSPLRLGCAGRLQTGFRHGEGQQEISEKRRLGIRGVQL
jgi:hypothetical protein